VLSNVATSQIWYCRRSSILIDLNHHFPILAAFGPPSLLCPNLHISGLCRRRRHHWHRRCRSGTDGSPTINTSHITFHDTSLSWRWQVRSHRIKSQRSRRLLLHRRICRSSKRRASREPHGEEPPGAVVHVGARHDRRRRGHRRGEERAPAAGAEHGLRLVGAVVLVHVAAGRAGGPERRRVRRRLRLLLPLRRRLLRFGGGARRTTALCWR
jgi:hypothetical protein